LAKPVVDDPGLDRTVPLDLWQHHLAHLGQHLLVRSLSLADEMQQRLMLGRRAMRRRDRRHRLNALPLARHRQASPIMPQRFLAVLVANHARKPLDNPVNRDSLSSVRRRLISAPKLM
jgi:hypothetical protein